MSNQQKYTSKLSGTRILIVGGSSGLGFGVAEGAVEHGAAAVIISSSNTTRIDAAVSKLKSSYPASTAEITGHVCNLGDEATVESNIETLFSKVGRLDHIVFTAGDGLAAKPLHDLDFATIKKAGIVRFFAPLLVAKHGSKCLNEGPASSITLTTGSVSERPIPDWAVVASYASGMHGMTRGLALDLKPIRVNLISPGGVDSEMWDMLADDHRKGLMENMAKNSATGRIGQVEDVVEAYLYVMKDKNITGAMISTNGGGLLM